MKKSILVIGGGVAGCSVAYFMKEKGYKVTLIDRHERVGGLARTCEYADHLYEFGPHIWFWPGGRDEPINNVIATLTDDRLFYIERKLSSFIEEDRRSYRYPVHYEDVKNMPQHAVIEAELRANRDDQMKLVQERLPVFGQCSFQDYFASAIGPTLYGKFMEQYTQKMWNIPGNELQTSMVWADRFNSAYSKADTVKQAGYDPLKFENHTLGKGIEFQVYPEGGWNQVWNRMVDGAEVIRDEISRLVDDGSNSHVLCRSGEKFRLRDFDLVVNTIDVDNLWGEELLPYTGRMIVPLLIPGIPFVFPDGTESIHYSGCEYQTRVTEMKTITRQKTGDAFLLIEIPILPGAEKAFPANTVAHGESNNLFCTKAYAQQSAAAIEMHRKLVERGRHFDNLHHCGRHAQFKYWGMPETVKSALEFSQAF